MTNNYKQKRPDLRAMAGWLRLLVLLTGLGLGWGSAWAQTTVTIGTGTLTASGTNGTPIYRSTGTSAFHHSKSIQLVTAADMATAGVPAGAIITQWGYNKTSAAGISGANAWTLNVYLKNSSATTLVSGTPWNTMISGATLAYSATINSSNFPASIGYWLWPISGFVYGGGAVECYIEWFPAGALVSPFTSGAFPWQYTTTTGNQAMGTSSSAVIPGTNAVYTTQGRIYNTRLTYTPGAADDLAVQAAVTPSGTICDGTSSTVSVTLRNIGTNTADFSVNPVTINASATGPNPTSFPPVTVNTGTLAPGATQVVTIATGYNAALSGTYNFSASLTWGPDGFAGNNNFNWSATSAFPVVASSNVYTFCDGTNPQLNTVVTLPTNAGPAGDDVQLAGVALPFPFQFFGAAQSTVNIYTNGFIQFGTSSASTTAYGSVIPSAAAPNNIVALFWEDLNVVAPGGTVSYFTDGVTPNRKFVVRYNNVNFFSATGLLSGQIVLNEIDNTIDVFITSVNNAGTESSVCGVENAAGSAGTVAPGRQFAVWTPNPVTNEGWKFSWNGSAYTVASIPHAPVSLSATYAWTPASGLSSTSIPNPTATVPSATSATYTVSATASGCTVSDTVLLTNLGAGDPAPATTGDAICQGATGTLSASGLSTLNWYTAPVGGTLVNTGPTYTSAFPSTQTFYVESFNGICPSARTPVTITVTPQPVINATATPSVLCLGDTTQLAANNFVDGNLTTALLAGNGASGNAFDITNLNGTSPIRIDSFYMAITAGTQAEVWFRPVGYGCANVTSNAGWTLAGTANIVPAGAVPNLTPIPVFVNVTIPVGQTFGFIVVTNGSNQYTNGTTICTPLINDPNIRISQGHGGTGFGGAFSFTFSPRNFNGRVFYSFGDPNLTFAWTQTAGSGSISNSSIANPVAVPTTSGTNTYELLATNLAGCTTTDNVSITVNPNPDDATSLTWNNSFCGCGVANLSAVLNTPGSDVRWYTVATGGTPIGTGTPFNAPNACGTQIYYAEAFDPITGCIQSGPRQSVTVTPLVAPSISIAATDLNLCDGDPAATLTASSTNDPNYTYLWSPSAGLTPDTGAVVSANPTATTLYTVTGTDGLTGCVGQASITIGKGNTPIISGATATPPSFCEGGSSQLLVTAINGGGGGAPDPEPPGYCAPVTFTSPGQTGDFINSVVFNTLNNPSGDDIDDYEFFPASGSTTTTIVAGSSYTLTVTPDPGFGQALAVFIDFNRNAIFEASEQVMNAASGTVPVTVTVNVPVTAVNGFARMRVVCVFAGTPGLTYACAPNSFGFGEVEDYSIAISGTAATPLTYSWTPAASLNNASIFNPVATPTTTTNYNVVVTDVGGCTATTSVPVNVVVPPAPPVVTNGSVCGQGNATLSATGSGGTLFWTDTIGGPILTTGNTFSPFVTSTQTYYVYEDQGSANANVGLSATAPGTLLFASSAANYQTFNVLSARGIIINSVDIVPAAATPLGTPIAIQLEDASGNALGAPVTAVTTTQGTVQTITLNMYVPQGNNYRLRPSSNPNLQYHQSGFVNPYTIPGQVSITGWGPPNATTLYVFFYNWSVRVFDNVNNTGCFSAPSIATATVTPAPPLVIDAPAGTSYCNSGAVVLDALISSGPYTSWSWSPAAGLSSSNNPVVTASPTTTTSYILTASDGFCTDTAMVTVTVNTGPTVSIAPAPFDSLCSGASFPINATSGSSSQKTIGTGTNSVNNTIAVYDGFNPNVRTQILYTAAELNAAGLIGPSNITSISFFVANKLSTTPLNGFTIRMANTAIAPPLTTAYLNPAFTTVFTGNVSTVLGWNQHTFTTAFAWDGVSNVIVEVCNGTPGAPAFDQVQSTPTAQNQTIIANLLGCTAATGLPGLNRPNTRFQGGQVTYSWSPATDLSSATIEDPVYTATSDGLKNYTLTVTDPSNGCTATANLSFMISGTPEAPTASSNTPSAICNSGTVDLSASGTSGSLQWQISGDGINFTDIPGATAATYSQLVNTDTWFLVKAFCSDTAYSNVLFFDVTAPPVPTGTGATVCGQGTVDLVANIAPGFFPLWFNDPTGGNAISNNDTLTTFVTQTDTFWVAAAVDTISPFQTVNGGAIAILDAAPANPYPSTINVSGLNIGSVVQSVSINGMSHTFPGDVDIVLVAPNGQAVTLMSDQGGGTDIANVNLTFQDGAPVVPLAIVSGTYAPTNDLTGETYPAPGPVTPAGSLSLSTFTGNLNGNWSLFIVDDAGGDLGTIANWSITFQNNVCQSTVRTPVVATVNPAPSIQIVPAVATICDGESIVLFDINGLYAGNYSWDPALTITNPANGEATASPTSTTTYILTGDDGLCQTSDTVVVTVNPLPVFTLSSSSPSVCGGGNVTITANVTSPVSGNYNVNSVAYTPFAGPLANSVPALNDEGTETVNLPFNFVFGGNTYNAVTIHANGQILMGGGNLSAQFQYTPPVIFSATAPNDWVGFWADLNVPLAGSITHEVIGSAPARKLVVRFTNVDFFLATPAVSYQIELNEGTNNIDVFYAGDNGVLNTKAIGLETGTAGFTPPGRNSGAWTATNEGWQFSPVSAATYSWTGPGIVGPNNTPSIVANPTTTSVYNCTVTDPNTGCTRTESITINASPNPQPFLVRNGIALSDTALCNPDTIMIRVADAGSFVGGYPAGTTFNWSAIGVPLPDLDSISSNNGSSYQVIVALPSGCVGTSNLVNVVTRTVSTNETITDATCVVPGKIVVQVASGLPSYRYLYTSDLAQTNVLRDVTTSSTSDSLTGLGAGTYYLQVFDTAGTPLSCNSGVKPIVVGGTSNPSVSFGAITNPNCFGASNGSIVVNWTGGLPPYDIAWSDGVTSGNQNSVSSPFTISNLTAGTWTVTVTDASTCFGSNSTVITEPAQVVVTLTSTPESPAGALNGTVKAVVSGGTPGYTYEWFDEFLVPIGTGDSLGGLAGGLYYSLVTDANGCQTVSAGLEDTIRVDVVNNAVFNLTFLFEGMYDGVGGMVPALLNSGVPGALATDVDTVVVELRDQLSTTTVLASGTGVVNTSGQVSFTFPSSVIGQNGYIAIFHRNAVQTWSDVLTFSSTNNYNFTTAASQAFGSNQIEVSPGVWAFYSGDIAPQDEVVDFIDQIVLDNDVSIFAFGYNASDITGDGVSDFLDQIILDNNVFNFVGSIHP